jgi:hypothetical protein
MKWLTGFVVVSLAALAVAAVTESPQSYDYAVVALKRKLFLETADGEQELQVGAVIKSGDTLRTGSRSRAELEVTEYAARFVLSSKTRFRLAHDRPGVLLEIERGSLRAVFGTLPEGDTRERLVATPSAVLAVRGTEYGVEVEKDGDTSIAVFEGTVEVWEASGVGERILIHAGQASRVRRGKAPSSPKPHQLSSRDWDRGRRNINRPMGSGQQMPGTGMRGQQGGAGAQSPSSRSGSGRRGG